MIRKLIEITKLVNKKVFIGYGKNSNYRRTG